MCKTLKILKQLNKKQLNFSLCFWLRKLSKHQSFSSNLGDQNLGKKFNKHEIIRKGENAVRAEK